MASTTGAHATPTITDPVFQEDVVKSYAGRIWLAILRLFIGWTFLWPFLDKLFGLGYTTTSDKAWIHGGTPAQGFLKGAEGPFAGLFHALAAPWADWLFMIGLLGIGLAVMLGMGLRVAAVTGTLLTFMMWLAEFPPTSHGTNPIVDDHLIYAASMITFAFLYAGDTIGFGKQWAKLIGSNTWLR